MKRIALGSLFFVATLAVYVFGQTVESLRPMESKRFSLPKDGVKEFNLQLKKGAYVELGWEETSHEGYWPVLSLVSPSGKELLETESASLIVPVEGSYRVIVTLKGEKEARPNVPQPLSLLYKNVFRIPANTVVRDARKVNGYDIKILVPKNTDEGGESILLIERAGKPEAIVKGESFGSLGFNFADKSGEGSAASAKLFASTSDKTGDGTPDVAIEYYSGGAHCCFSMHFFELGKEVTKVPVLSTGDAPISAIGKNPKGGLFLATADNNFAYWNVPFAESPFGDLVLEFREGQFRPSASKMLKPAPSLLELRKKATAARSIMNNVQYLGSDSAAADDKVVFEEAFWSTMIDLVYTGHRELAWEYLDMVWPKAKKGKEIFKRDFQEQLESSQFWGEIKGLGAARP